MIRLVTVPARYLHARRVRLAFITMAAVSFVALATLTFAIRENRKLARQGDEAHSALCVFKADLARRVSESSSYLAENPGPVFGIPRATVEQSVTNQRSTLESLDLLDCG